MRKDRVNLLYADQVLFDRNGEPLVSVGLLRGLSKLEVRCKHPLTLLPGGDPDYQVTAPAGSEWVVKLSDSHPGKSRYWVEIGRFSSSRMERGAEITARLADRGLPYQIFETGALVGFGGRTVNTRSSTLAAASQPTLSKAKTKARELLSLGLGTGDVYTEPLERPHARIIAQEIHTGATIEAHDLLTLLPTEDGTVELHTGKKRRQVPGEVMLTVGANGKLVVVVLVSAERLLEGVVPSEIYPFAPLAALKAQAVAARGQLLGRVGTRHRGEPYLLCASAHCQAYTGETLTNDAVRKAVQQTRGLVLVDHGGLTDTFYHAACGGHTESFHEMWGMSPDSTLPAAYDRPDGSLARLTEANVKDFIEHPTEAYCSESSKQFGAWRWTSKRTGAQITKAVNQRKAVGPVHTIKVLKRGGGGRAIVVEYVGKSGTLVVDGAMPNIRLLGGLRSSLFVVERHGGTPGGEPTQWQFKGAGYGHGVGLCQQGAMGMSRRGLDFKAILEHYYRGARLEKIW